jgi:hypothetical protein
MTADEICEAALARCAEVNAKVPSTRGVMYRRISTRQQQIFAHIAEVEPEYFGKSAIAPLVGGSFSLELLDPEAERVTFVQIAEPGTSQLGIGDRVNVVAVMDMNAADPPRATLRDAVLQQVGAELDGVTSLTIHYSKRAQTMELGSDGSEVPAQFEELLVIDLHKHLMRKTSSLNVEERDKLLKVIELEEAELMADLDRHLEHWRYVEVARFDHSQRPQPRPTS